MKLEFLLFEHLEVKYNKLLKINSKLCAKFLFFNIMQLFHSAEKII